METAPPALPPPMPDSAVQAVRDEEHLRVLSIGYYVVGGFTALFSCLFIFHIVMGLLIVGGAFPPGPPPVRHSVSSVTMPGGGVSVSRATASEDAETPAAAPKPPGRPFSPTADAPRQDEPFAPDRANPPRRGDPGMPRAFGLLFVFMGAAFVLIGWTVGGLTIYAGRCLQTRRHRTFTLIVAGINCLHIPFGTALGVFTFIVLQRPSVAALYAHPLAGPMRVASV